MPSTKLPPVSASTSSETQQTNYVRADEGRSRGFYKAQRSGAAHGSVAAAAKGSVCVFDFDLTPAQRIR